MSLRLLGGGTLFFLRGGKELFFSLRVHRSPRDQLDLVQRFMYRLIQKIKNSLRIREAYLHLRRMHVDVNVLRCRLQIKDGKGKTVLHQIRSIALLQALGKDIAFQNSSVDEEDFLISARARKFRSSQKAADRQLVLSFAGGRPCDRNDGI